MEPRAPLPASAAPRPASPPPLTVNVPAIVALSEDAALLQALTLAVIEQAAVVSSPSADRFVDQLVSNDAEIALIDAASAPNPITSFLSGLRRQLPQLRLIVAGSAAAQRELSGQIADGTVFRYALKPASAQRLRLMLCTTLRTDRPAVPGASVLPGSSGPSARGHLDEQAEMIERPSLTGETPTNPAPRWLWPLLLVLTALGAMVVGWYASSFASLRHWWP